MVPAKQIDLLGLVYCMEANINKVVKFQAPMSYPNLWLKITLPEAAVILQIEIRSIFEGCLVCLKLALNLCKSKFEQKSVPARSIN